MRRAPIFVGTGLVSVGVLMLELGLTRLLSATMYYHFAFLTISLALLGSGAGGVAIYVGRRGVVAEIRPRLLVLAALLFAVTTFVAVVVILGHPLTLEPGPGNLLRLALVCGAAALPFFFAGCATALAVAGVPSRMDRLYLFDLGGAAAGCLLLIPALDALGAIHTLLSVAALAATAAASFSLTAWDAPVSRTSGVPRRLPPAREARALLAVSLVVGAGSVAATIANNHTEWVGIRHAKGLAQGHLLFSKWNSFSRVTVSGDLRDDPSLLIRIDADAATPIPRAGGDDDLVSREQRDSEAIAYRLTRQPDVLILGSGGGGDVRRALVYGARRVTAVEVNPIIARDILPAEPFRSYSGAVYERPGVRLVVDEGRSFIRGSRERYDIIQATMVDTWAATAAGAFALSENYLYTSEAFSDYATHLRDDGFLVVTRWYVEPPDQILRLVSLARAMMSDLGIPDPPRHLMVLRQGQLGADGRAPGTMIFKKSPLTDDELETIQRLPDEGYLTLLYTARARPDNAFTRLIEAPDPSTVWRSFPTDISPTRDDSPFFFNSVRLANLAAVFKGGEEWRKTNLGTLILVVLLAATAMLLALFVAGPLVLAARSCSITPRTGLGALIYFVLLGGGFLIVEVVLVQKFILFLGRPIDSLAVVLFSLLVFSAGGSALSGRVPEERLPAILPRVLLALAGLLLVYVLALPPMVHGLVQLDRPARIAITVALLAPVALLMGMPLPSGVRLLARRSPALIPWAWGLNGAASVTGSVAALVLALLVGLKAALLAGAALYLLAALAVARFPPEQPLGVPRSDGPMDQT